MVGRAEMRGGKTLGGEIRYDGPPARGNVLLTMHRFPVRLKERGASLGFSNYQKELVVDLEGQNLGAISWQPQVPTFAPTAWICSPLVNYDDFYLMMDSVGGGGKSGFASRLLQPFFFGDSRALQHVLRLSLIHDGKEKATDETSVALE
jgi:hypothetical protein